MDATQEALLPFGLWFLLVGGLCVKFSGSVATLLRALVGSDLPMVRVNESGKWPLMWAIGVLFLVIGAALTTAGVVDLTRSGI